METISISADQLAAKDVVLRGRLADVEREMDALIALHTHGQSVISRKTDETFDPISNEWYSRMRVVLVSAASVKSA